jgi:hypothetical protein
MAVVVNPVVFYRNNVDFGQWLSAMGHSRRFHTHGASLSNPDEIALAIGKSLQDHMAKLRERHVHTQNMYNSGSVDRNIFFTDNCKFRFMKEGNVTKGGYCVLNGELIGFWCNVKGSGTWLLDHAIKDGATHLNCFDGYLVDFYKARGFVTTKYVSNWTDGEPDVVFMELGAL